MIFVQFIVMLVLLGIRCVSACEPPPDYVPIAKRETNALLFKVTGCDTPVRYLFGTFHSDSPKLQPIVDHASPYLQQTKRLWVEIVSAPEHLVQSQRLMMLPPEGPTLREMIGEKLYQRTKERIAPALGLSESAMQRFKPWALALLVQYPPPVADGVILDVKLQHLAALKAVPISGLEQLEAQLNIFTQMDERMQVEFLQSTLDDFDRIQKSIEELADHYQQQNIYAIAQLSRELFDDMQHEYPELAHYLEQRLIDQRNSKMAHKMLNDINYPAFIAVGALHLPGKTGLLHHMESAGLQITPLPMLP